VERDLNKVTHLNDQAKAYLERSDEERKLMIEADRWLTYPIAKNVVEVLDEKLFVAQNVRKNRPLGVVLAADGGNGKTSLLKHFLSTHPPKRLEDGRRMVPVMMIETPRATVRNLYGLILKQLQASVGQKDDEIRMKEQIQDLFETLEVRMLMLDEAHNMLNAPQQRRGEFLEALIWLNNNLQIPLVVAGVPTVRDAIRKDGYDQLATRLEPIELPIWKHDDDYTDLLANFERTIPLWNESNIADNSKITDAILYKSSGRIGAIWEFLIRCAKNAIKTKVEQITLEIVETTTFVPPNEHGSGSLF
jgi:hypothetical protein